MAKIKVVSVVKRTVTIDVVWDDGLSKKGLIVDDVPVEDFQLSRQKLFDYVTWIYGQVKAEADALAYNNPTIAPEVLAAVGHTFDDQGNVVS